MTFARVALLGCVLVQTGDAYRTFDTGGGHPQLSAVTYDTAYMVCVTQATTAGSAKLLCHRLTVGTSLGWRGSLQQHSNV